MLPESLDSIPLAIELWMAGGLRLSSMLEESSWKEAIPFATGLWVELGLPLNMLPESLESVPLIDTEEALRPESLDSVPLVAVEKGLGLWLASDIRLEGEGLSAEPPGENEKSEVAATPPL
eukprot:8983081-Pyramimonas_sp.AAC.1